MKKSIIVPKELAISTLISFLIATPLFADNQNAVSVEDLRSIDPAQRLEIVESVALDSSENAQTNMTINIAIRNIEQAMESHGLENDSFLRSVHESLSEMKMKASDQQNMISMVISGEPASYCVDQCGDGIFQEVVCQATDCACAETQESCLVDYEAMQIKNGEAIASESERYQHAENSSQEDHQGVAQNSSTESSASESSSVSNSSGSSAGTVEKVIGEDLYRAQEDVVSTVGSLAERSLRYSVAKPVEVYTEVYTKAAETVIEAATPLVERQLRYSVAKPAEAHAKAYQSAYKEAFRGAKRVGREIARTAERIGREIGRIFSW